MLSNVSLKICISSATILILLQRDIAERLKILSVLYMSIGLQMNHL